MNSTLPQDRYPSLRAATGLSAAKASGHARGLFGEKVAASATEKTPFFGGPPPWRRTRGIRCGAPANRYSSNPDLGLEGFRWLPALRVQVRLLVISPNNKHVSFFRFKVSIVLHGVVNQEELNRRTSIWRT